MSELGNCLTDLVLWLLLVILIFYQIIGYLNGGGEPAPPATPDALLVAAAAPPPGKRCAATREDLAAWVRGRSRGGESAEGLDWRWRAMMPCKKTPNQGTHDSDSGYRFKI